MPVWVVISNTPVYMRERGGGGRGEFVTQTKKKLCFWQGQSSLLQDTCFRILKQGGSTAKERIHIWQSSQGSRSRSQQYIETSLMSESLVDVSDVQETVTQVLTQLLQDSGR